MRTVQQMIQAERVGLRALTDREMDVRQVASIICENYPISTQYDDPAPSVQEWAERINDDEGWSYDCCYPSQQPYSPGWFTRVEGKSLSDDDLAAAVALAEALWAEEDRRRAEEKRLAEEARARRQEAEARREQARQDYWRLANKIGPDRPTQEELMRLRREAGL